MKTKINYSFLFLVLFLVPLAAAAQTSGASSLKVTGFTSALLLVFVVIGVLINLWKITRKYGGVIGKGLRLIGTGIVFLAIEAMDRAIQTFTAQGVISLIVSDPFIEIAYDLILVLALFFVTLGFVKFYSATEN